MPTIYTHPSNEQAVKQMLADMGAVNYRVEANKHLEPGTAITLQDQPCVFELPMTTSIDFENKKWTGGYVLPDGRTMRPEDMATPFEWDASAEGIEWLLENGIIRKEMAERGFLDAVSRMWFEPVTMSPRMLIRDTT